VNPIGYSSLECSAPDGLVVLRLATTRMKIDIGRFPVQRKRNATLVLPSMRIASSYFEVKLWRCQRVEHVKSRKVRKLNSNAQKKSNAFSLLAAARKREREREREREEEVKQLIKRLQHLASVSCSKQDPFHRVLRESIPCPYQYPFVSFRIPLPFPPGRKGSQYNNIGTSTQ
jgi:hypothetical protein